MDLRDTTKASNIRTKFQRNRINVRREIAEKPCYIHTHSRLITLALLTMLKTYFECLKNVEVTAVDVYEFFEIHRKHSSISVDTLRMDFPW